MIRRATALAVTAALVTLSPGCGLSKSSSDSQDTSGSLTGNWSGEIDVLGIGVATVELSLTEDSDSQLSGTASVSGLTEQALEGDVTGARSDTDVTIVASGGTLGTAIFDGTLVSKDVMNGHLTISGEDTSYSLALTRE